MHRQETAALFAREGARVAIVDLKQKGADAAADELGGAKRAIGVAVDVTNEAQVDACVAKTVAAFGQIDSLSRTLASRGFLRTPLVDKQIPDQAKKPAQPVSATPSLPQPAPTPNSMNRLDRMIEIALPGGVSVRVDAQVDSGALRRALAVLARR